MKTLILMRHAKSSWADPAAGDFDRPLNERGRRDAPRMAAWLSAQKLAPDVVLCSSAVRTTETLALVRTAWPDTVKVKLQKPLYLASEAVLLKTVRAAANPVSTLMLIGHNPGIEVLARNLTGEGSKTLRNALDEKFPTAAIAVLTFELATWKSIATGSGRLKHFITPKSLSS